jgi:hypothetical protein
MRVKLRRYTPAFYRDNGRFRCHLNRYDVAELLANGEANLECDHCGSVATEIPCIGGNDHEWVLWLHPVNFNRQGRPSSLTHAEIEANAGAHGCLPKFRVQAKLEEMYGETKSRVS